MSTRKIVSMVNDRGYLFVGKHEGCPDLSKVKTYDLTSHEEKDQKNTTFTFHGDDTGKIEAGNMVRNGYLQVGKIFKERDEKIVTILFRTDGKILVAVASKEEIAASKAAEEANDARKAESKKAGKKQGPGRPAEEDLIAKLVKEGKVAPVEGKEGRFEYIIAPEVKAGDNITALRKSGTFIVKSVNNEKGHIDTVDASGAHHFFGIKEVAIA
jgi:hypothetical protein